METETIVPEMVNWKKRFFMIWTGQAFSMLGSHLVGFAFVWYLTATTGSATVLATGTLVSMLPNIIISPIAGALIDRWNRKTVLIVFDTLTALVTLILALLFTFGSVQVWQIYIVMFIRSAFGSFQWAAMLTSTSLMVPKSRLARVAGMNQTLQGIMSILAPPLGAFLIGIMPTAGVLMVDVITAVIAITPLFLFRIPQPERSAHEKDENGKIKSSVWQDLAEGFKYVAGWPGLLAIILIAMLINLLVNPAFSLIPILVTQYFNKGAMDLGLIESVFGVGFLIGGLVLSVWGGFKNRLITSMTALIMMGVSISLVGIVPQNGFYWAAGVLGLAGIMNPLVNGPIFAALQSRVDPQKQGRVFTLLNAGASLASPLGLAIAGPVSDAVGIQIWFIIGGVACVIAGIASLCIPSIIELGKGVGVDSTVVIAAESSSN
ncbi:MAG: MFS transporter [Chloroflexota bacterium]